MVAELSARHALPKEIVEGVSERTGVSRGLSVGADDYVVKPFSVPELMARVHALLRRTAQAASCRLRIHWASAVIRAP